MRDLRPPRSLSPVVPVTAGLAIVLLLAVATRYGYHRDELYFLAAARRLAWGYGDQPPLTIGIVWLADALFGSSLLGLRLFPAVATGVTVFIAGLVARRLGGGTAAQATAAVGIAGGGFFLAAGHLLSTATFDTMLWAIVLLLAVHLYQGGDVEGILNRVCSDTRQVAVIDSGFDLDNEEQGQPIWLCTARTGSWESIWDDVRHYN